MTEDNTLLPPDLPKEATVVNLAQFKKDKEVDKTILGDGASKQPTPTKELSKSRRYIVELKDDTIEIEGLVGLTGSFLAVGDPETGNIKLGVAAGEWILIVDVTDSGKTLEDFKNETT